MLSHFRLSTSLLLIISFVFSNCVCSRSIITKSKEKGYKYTIRQLLKYEEIYNYVTGRKVIVEKRNDELISGYFIEMKENSIAVRLNKNSKQIIPNDQVRYIIVRDNQVRDNQRGIKAVQLIAGAAALAWFLLIIVGLSELGRSYPNN